MLPAHPVVKHTWGCFRFLFVSSTWSQTGQDASHTCQVHHRVAHFRCNWVAAFWDSSGVQQLLHNSACTAGCGLPHAARSRHRNNPADDLGPILDFFSRSMHVRPTPGGCGMSGLLSFGSAECIRQSATPVVLPTRLAVFRTVLLALFVSALLLFFSPTAPCCNSLSYKIWQMSAAVSSAMLLQHFLFAPLT
jgi:hypothetical protein